MVTIEHPGVEYALAAGTEDWVRLTDITAAVRDEADEWHDGEGSPTEEEIKSGFLQVCCFLLSEGLMTAGEVRKPTPDHPEPFFDWPGTFEEVVGRVSRDWASLTAGPLYGKCWFRNTQRGYEVGQLIPEDPHPERYV